MLNLFSKIEKENGERKIESIFYNVYKNMKRGK